MNTLNMPSFGSDMDVGKVVEWAVKPGDSFTKGQTLALIETAKGLIDMEAFENGIMESYLVALDEEVTVGTPILSLVSEINGAHLENSKTDVKEEKLSVEPAMKPDIFDSKSKKISPAARAYANEHDIDLEKIKGSGPLKSIVLKDLENVFQKTAQTGKGFDINQMRKAISRIVSQSKKEIPHYYLALTINVEKLQLWLNTQNDQKGVEDRLLIQAPILCAIKNALKKNPKFNGYFIEDGFESREQINLGIAISLRGGGLVVPALLNVGELHSEQIMERLKSLSERAKKGGLKHSEVANATITISNIGDRGVDVIYGVIFPPQVAIIGVGKVQKTPVCVNNEVVINSLMTMTLAADHRVTDGHDGARLLNEIDKQLQKPEELS